MATTAKTRTTSTTGVRRKSVPAHPLKELIPHPDLIDGYVQRKFGDYTDIDLFEYADSSDMNVLLFGPTGPGKTRGVFSYGALGPVVNMKTGARTPKPVVTVACNGGVDPATFWGEPTKTPNGSIKFVESSILTVIRHGGILYLDEVNFLHPRIGAVFHGLLDDRRAVVVPQLGNEYVKAHRDLFVVAAYNPDYQGTRPLNEAFKNRFKLKLHYDYDREIEEKIVPPFEGVDVTSLLNLADKLRRLTQEGELSTPVSTNMLMDFVIIGMDTNLDFAISNFVNSFHADERQPVLNNFQLIYDDLHDMLKDAVGKAEDPT